MSDIEKKIKFGIGIDTSGLEQQVSNLRSKIAQMTRNDQYMDRAKSVLGETSPQTQQSQKIFQRERQADIRALTKEYEKMEDASKKLEKRMEAITKQMVTQTEEQKKQTQEMLDRMAKESAALERGKIEAKQGLQQLGGGGNQPPGGEIPGMGGAGGGGLKALLQGIGVSAIVKGALNSIVKLTEDAITRDRSILGAQGVAAQVGSRELREAYAGQGYRGGFYAEERARAMGMASKEAGGRSTVDWMKLGRSAIAGAVTGATAGTAMMPGLGTLGGGILGAIGGVGTAMLGNDRLRNKILDPERYNSMITTEGMQNYESNLAAIKAQNVEKTVAGQVFEQEMPAMFNFQKRFGLSDKDLLGGKRNKRPVGAPIISGDLMKDPEEKGVFEPGMDEGFDKESLMQFAQQIAQSGGTTRGAIEGMTGAARLERQFGLGNAGQLMGRLSGAGMDATQSEEALKKLLGEAVQMGVDESEIAKMPQEMQRFTATAIEMATKSGGFAQGAVDVLQAGAMDFTSKGLEGAKAAADIFEQKSKASGGIEGQIGFGAISKAAKGMGIDLTSKDLTFLNQLSIKDLREGDYQSLAASMNIADDEEKDGKVRTGADKIKQLIETTNKTKQTRFDTTDDRKKALAEKMSKLSEEQRKEIRRKIQSGETFSKGELGADIAADFMGLQRDVVSEGSGGTSDMNTLRAQAGSLIGMETGEFKGAGKALEGVPTGRDIGESQQKGRAVGDAARMDALNSYSDDLVNSVSKLSKGAVMYQEQMDLFIKAAKSGAEGMDEIKDKLQAIADDLRNKETNLMLGGGTPR